jgi:hypothetical protein
MQWVLITRDNSAMELRLEMTMGSVRSTVIAVMQRWVRKPQHDRAWSVLVLGNELCSDVVHHALMAWATLLEPTRHTRFTGEAASLIRLTETGDTHEEEAPPELLWHSSEILTVLPFLVDKPISLSTSSRNVCRPRLVN